MTDSCPLCALVDRIRSGGDPMLVHEFTHSYLMVGSHQFHRGYCCVVAKRHVRDMLDFDAAARSVLFAEVMQSAQAISDEFQPWKLNYASYGNTVPHVHWHIFPRYAEDPDRLNHPWLHADRFDDCATSAETASDIRMSLQRRLGDLTPL